MKTRFYLSGALLPLLLCAPLTAQQGGNPFRQVPTSNAAAAGSPAGPFVSLCEHVLVPRKVLDAWLSEHPLQGGDAGELRKMAATWIADDTAKLDYTGLISGGTGKSCESEAIQEQIYPTEYEPAYPGQWAHPTSFETRNLGYSFSGGDMQTDKGGTVLTGQMGHTTMLLDQQIIWDQLAKETKKPGDIFIPTFRNVHVSRQKEEPKDGQEDKPPSNDPFAATEGPKVKDVEIQFEPGRIYVSRMSSDDRDPAAIIERLIFFSGALRPEAAPKEKETVPEDYQMSCRIYRVDHRTASDWLQRRELTTVPDLAWETVEGWSRDGKAEAIGNLSAAGRPGLDNQVENTVEIVYPTEYEAPEPTELPDGKGYVSDFANATSFETRNTGLSLKTRLLAEDVDPRLHIEIGQTRLLGMSVVHRILKDGEWKENMTMPVFATNRWDNELHLLRGKWQLVGISGDFSKETRLPDPTHCLFAFIKVE